MTGRLGNLAEQMREPIPIAACQGMTKCKMPNSRRCEDPEILGEPHVA